MLRLLGLTKGAIIHGYSLKAYQVIGRSTGHPLLATPSATTTRVGRTSSVRYSMHWEPSLRHHDYQKLLDVLTAHMETTPLVVDHIQTRSRHKWILKVVDHTRDPIGGDVIVCAEARLQANE